jgi:methyl-accepting chemotaxis protein
MSGYGLVFYRFISENYDTIVELSPITEDSKAILYNELSSIIMYLSLLSGIFLIAITGIGIVFSHKVAGPMFKIKSVCNSINTGNFGKRIALRPGDDFREVVAELNKALNTLHASQSKVYRIAQSETLMNEVFAVERLVALVDEKKLSSGALVSDLQHPDQSPVSVLSVIAEHNQAKKPA